MSWDKCLTSKNIVALKFRLGVTRGHWKCDSTDRPCTSSYSSLLLLLLFMPSVSKITRDFGKKIDTKEKIVGVTILLRVVLPNKGIVQQNAVIMDARSA